MIFNSREEAARALVRPLWRFRDEHPLILAVPRGAVPMGKVLAEALDADLDVVLVHKLGAPGNPELAIGSIDENGSVYLGTYMVESTGVSGEYIDTEAQRQLASLRRRREQYTPLRPPVSREGRTVIVLDNGVATCATLIAALRAVRAQGPRKLVAAAAVAPQAALRRLEAEADEVACLYSPESFLAVGQFFRDFSQVSDEQVAEILKATAAASEPTAAERP